jgi:trigger factor
MSEEQVSEILRLQNRSREDLVAEWRPDAEKNIKQRLLINKIVEEEKLEVADNELEEEIKNQAEQSDMSLEEAKESLAKNNGMEYLRSDVLDRKLYDFLLDQASVKKGKKTKFLDLVQENQ